MNEVIQVKHVKDHTLHVVFDNGMEGEIDLSTYPSKGPIFSPLSNVEYFKRAFIEGGTIAWPNGADIAPESVYELLGRVSANEGIR
ncbi:DUF2442 domain-containing protein [Kamptonema cortianum]|nr:DUF2442 domain-containing protein [Kamptonema cortianum]MDL5051096.1 DUF2442 domain-containing protein [Oscillatoria amoena NRMC-F 0135]